MSRRKPLCLTHPTIEAWCGGDLAQSWKAFRAKGGSAADFDDVILTLALAVAKLHCPWWFSK